MIVPFHVYTDGGQKRQWGSWAYVVVRRDRVLFEKSGREKERDSTRMEFRAAIEALKALPLKSKAIVKSDSRVVIDVMTLDVPVWKTLGWRKKRGQPIPNLDLIRELDELAQSHSVQWSWVRGHAGNVYNERCDSLCSEARGC